MGDVLDQFSVSNRLEVFAHSWGALVLLGALRHRTALRISGLLIAPVPSTRAKFEEMRANLFSRFPQELLQKLAGFNGEKLAGSDLQPFLSHYLSNKAANLDGLSFETADYQSIIETLGDYDFGALLRQLSKCHVIHGSDDFITPSLIDDYATNCLSTVVMPNAGHFPFAEHPEAFLNHAKSFI